MSAAPIELARDIVRGWDTLPSAAPGRIEELRLARALLASDRQLHELRAERDALRAALELPGRTSE